MKRWKVIRQFSNYAITRGGTVKRIIGGQGARIGRILKPFTVAGYPAFDLWQHGRRRIVYTHRLVAATFIRNPKRLTWVNHRSGNETNPRVSNLEWTTPRFNTTHAQQAGLTATGSRCHSILLTADMRDIRKLLASGERGCDLAAEYSVSRQTISAINRGRNWKQA